MSAPLRTDMAFPRRNPLLAPIPALSLSLACAGVLFYGYCFAAGLFPAHVGPNRAFFRACRNIRAGASVQEVRSLMSPYLEVGRTWSPPSTFPAGLFQATVLNIRESRSEHEARIVFIPNPADSADWCLLYPDSSGYVVRAEISPD